MHPTASVLLKYGFCGLTAAVLVVVLLALRRASLAAGRDPAKEVRRASLVLVGTMVVGSVLAFVGVLQDFSLPPKMPIFVFTILGLTIWLGVSKYGAFLSQAMPLGVLVGVNAFRLPLEVLMNQAYLEGVMPVQMSYSGQNYDVFTGMLALFVLVVLRSGKKSLRLVRIFNTVGIVLLFNILAIAVVSMPLPIRVYMNEPANTWIAYFPFVWLPTFLVPVALLSHILILRRLAVEMESARRKADETRPSASLGG